MFKLSVSPNTLPALKRVSYLAVFLCMAMALFSGAFAATNPDVQQSWTAEYSRLKVQVVSRSQHSDSVYDANSLIQAGDTDALTVILRRTQALVNDIKAQVDITALETGFNSLKSLAASVSIVDTVQRRTLFFQACSLQREISFANPLLNFDSVLFVAHGKNGGDEHMIDQYFGLYGRQAGGIYLVRHFKTNPEVLDVMQNSTVQNGRFVGQKLAGGAFISPELSYDGNKIAFAWRQPGTTGTLAAMTKEICYHVFTANSDGTNLTQLTEGPYDDYEPCFLPNGRFVFLSNRRGGVTGAHTRCSTPRPLPNSTLYSMKQDGSDIICLSYHETQEWHPSVATDGKIVYTRWDYVDRDADVAHHIWTCYPDGRDPRAWHGNYPVPTSVLGSGDGRIARPWAEFNIRSIPQSTSLYIATAGPHHGQSFGSLVLINVDVPDNGKMSQVRRITPETPFSESETGGFGTCGPYTWGTTWPLSEDYYLVSYIDGGLYLLDRFGNRNLICALSAIAGFTNPTGLRLIDPIPFRSRERPNPISTFTFQGERSSLPEHAKATINVQNVYVTDLPFPPQTKIKWMRMIQTIPKMTPSQDIPKIGNWDMSLARMPIGIVPVEDDGSVYCEAPVGKEIYFQLLDSNFMAVQSVRSGTYVHAGEQMSCIGCHENKWQTPPAQPNSAVRRAPSPIIPEAGGVEPLNFHRLVRPVFENKCILCHVQKMKGPQAMNYSDSTFVRNYAFGFGVKSPAYIGSRTIPGQFGAAYSRMGKALLDSTHQRYLADGILSKDDFRRVVLWLDCNSNELGSYFDEDKQRQGLLVWPKLDIDTLNPQGVEWDRPVFNYTLDATPPSAPSGLQAQVLGNSRIRLNWQASNDAESGVWIYRIYRDGVPQAYTCSTWFKDTYLKTGTNYTYQVTALNPDHLESSKSNQVSATTGTASVPSVPQNVTAVNNGYVNGYCQISLNWNASADPEFGIWCYRIFRNDSLIGTTAGTAYVDSEAEGQQSYGYRIAAMSYDLVESARSPAVSLLTPADILPPVLQSVFMAADSVRIILTFNERLDKPSAETAGNYGVSPGISVVSAVLLADARHVTLTVSPALSYGITYTVYVNGIKDRLGNMIPANTSISFSTDLWKTLREVLNGGGGTERLAVSGQGRYVRMFGILRGTMYGFSLWEFEIYSGGVNVALNKPVAVSSGATGSTAANYAVDGDISTRWSSARLDSQYIIVDLGQSQQVDSVVLKWEAAFGKQYKIQIAPDTVLGTPDEGEGTGLEKDRGFEISPNPFNPSVRIGLPRFQGQGLVRIHDVSGRCVREYRVGPHERRLIWDGRDTDNRPVSSGLYLITFAGQGETLRKKATLMR